MKTESVKVVLGLLNSDARNAMHSILGFLDLARDGTLDPAQRKYIETCQGVAERHFRCIEDVQAILGIGQVEDLEQINFRPVEMFARVVEVMGVIAERNGVRLTSNVDISAPLVVSADLNRIGCTLLRISEAVMNLVIGADVQVNLRASHSVEGRTLVFEINVTGRTMPSVLIQALQQDMLDFDDLSEANGLLGLAAARCLALSLGGGLEASTDASTGTHISVFVPVGESLPLVEAVALGDEVRPKSRRALRILVAEDSNDSFQLFEAFLQTEPHVLVRAHDGEEAVQLATTDHFDLVFMDIRMPRLDGYVATQKIREWETGKDRPRTPIIVLSAENLRSQRRQGALVGCSGHLEKPLRKEHLLAAISAYSPGSERPATEMTGTRQ